MSIITSQVVRCGCGADVEVRVADSINAEEHPHLRKAVIDRQLHTFKCGACAHLVIVEKEVFYLDVGRHQFLCVFPWQDRVHERERCEQVMAAYELALGSGAPAALAEIGGSFLVRVCFGYEELREKLLIDDTGLSDLAVEALKCDLLAGDPWYRENLVATLRLDAVTPGGALRFAPERLAPLRLDPEMMIEVERDVYDAVYRGYKTILARRPGLASGPHVSLLRMVNWSAFRNATPAARSDPGQGPERTG